MLSFKIFTQYLLSRRSGSLIRTIAWLCILGIAVGVMCLIIVISVMNGFNATIRERHLRVEPHLVVNFQGKSEEFLAWNDRIKALLVEPDVQRQLSESNVFETQDLIVKTVEGAFAGAVAKGYANSGLESFLKRAKEPARAKNSLGSSKSTNNIDTSDLVDDSWSLGPGEVVMGYDLARSLNLYPGDEVVVIPPESLLMPADEAPPYEKVRIKSVVSTRLQDVDGKLLFYNREQTLRTFKNAASRELGLEIRLLAGEQYAGLQDHFRKRGFAVESWPERNAALFFALKMEKLAMTIFLSLSALITSFSILTVLILLVTQKRRDIGILMAMGLTPKRTRAVFAQVGLWLSSVGVLSGVIIGVAVCLTIEHFPMDLLPDVIYYDTTIPAEVSPLMVGIVLVVAFAIAMAGSWFPAHRSARSTPAEALRGSLRDV